MNPKLAVRMDIHIIDVMFFSTNLISAAGDITVHNCTLLFCYQQQIDLSFSQLIRTIFT